MRQLFFALVFILGMKSCEALICMNCDNAENDLHCRQIGKIERCHPNDQSCYTEVRQGQNQNNRITKRCKQSMACLNNRAHNALFCNPSLGESICRCCCNTNKCNDNQYRCGIDEPTPTKNTPDTRSGKCDGPPEAPENGRVDCKDNEKGPCKFTCDEGFALDGYDTAICADLGPGGMEWSEAPSCKKMKCHEDLHPPIGGVLGLCNLADSIDSSCFAACYTGFRPIGSLTAHCTKEGRWSEWDGSCLPITCPTLSPPRFGGFMCSDENNYNSSCTFICNPKFAMVEGGAKHTRCQDVGMEGVWSHPTPTCKAIKCNELSKPTYGTLTCKKGNFVGSECIFTCYGGYWLEGTAELLCNEDNNADGVGAWSNSAPSCKRVYCKERMEFLENGNVECSNKHFAGSECEFYCNEGYVLDGPAAIDCVHIGQKYGEWSKPAPTCKPMHCLPGLDPPTNGTIQCDGNVVGSKCEFFCSEGYFLDGQIASLCLADQNGDGIGEWRHGPPDCDRIMCPDILDFEHGEFVCTDESWFNSRCDFKCDQGYQLVGVKKTICVSNVADYGKWTNKIPECEPLKCMEQDPISHGIVNCTDENNVNSICKFGCVDDSYSLYPSGIDENVCLTNQAWNIPKPCCAKSCPPNAFMDFVIILDSSSSITKKNWDVIITFVKQFLDKFDMASDSARFALFRYNRKIYSDSEIKLGEIRSNEEFNHQLDTMEYDGSGTFTGQALEYAVKILASDQNRPTAPDLVLLITDGNSQDDIETPALQLRNRPNTTIYVLPVRAPKKDYDNSMIEQMETITGNKENVIIDSYINGFTGLTEELSKKISGLICGDPCYHENM